MSLLTSVLIVWLYIGGNIVRRLRALSAGRGLTLWGRNFRRLVTANIQRPLAPFEKAVREQGLSEAKARGI